MAHKGHLGARAEPLSSHRGWGRGCSSYFSPLVIHTAEERRMAQALASLCPSARSAPPGSHTPPPQPVAGPAAHRPHAWFLGAKGQGKEKVGWLFAESAPQIRLVPLEPVYAVEWLLPPVARRSSTTTTFCPGSKASFWISSSACRQEA